MRNLSQVHRRFLLLDQGVGAMIFNFVLNGGIAWAMFRSATTVPLWGQSSIAVDTLVTAFVLPLLTSLIVSRLVHRQVARGVVPPLSPGDAAAAAWARRSSFQRGAALGIGAVIVAAVPTVLVFTLAGPPALGRWPFIWFKAAFAGGLAALVTPVLAWWALAHASESAEMP